MLLNSYTKEFVRLSCGSEAQPLDLIAHLNQDISEVIPYLNAVLGGFQYTKDPSFRFPQATWEAGRDSSEENLRKCPQ